MKKLFGIAAAAVLLGAVIYFLVMRSAWKSAEEAVGACTAAVEGYNSAIAPYNEAVGKIAAAEKEFQEVMGKARTAADSGDKAYEPETQKVLKKALEKAEKEKVLVPGTIEPLENMEGKLQEVDRFSKSSLDALAAEAEAAAREAEEAKMGIPEVPKIPDHSAAIESIGKALKAYEDSVQKLANVTVPDEGFVRERLLSIKTVTKAEPVSKGNDPNGLLGTKGGYVGCVYFADRRVDIELLPEAARVRAPGEDSGDEEESDSAAGSTEETAAAPDAGDTGESAAAAAGSTGETAAAPDAGNTGESAEAAVGSSNGTAASPDAGDTGESAEAAVGSTGETAASPDAGNTGESAAAAAGSTGETAAAPDAGSTGESAAAAAGSTGETAAAPDAGSTGESAAAEDADSEKEDAPFINVVIAGTAGGGAVEIFATEKEARARDEYLGFFEGSIFEPGFHTVEKTCVIRTSAFLSEEEREALAEEVRKALLAVGE